MTGTKAQSAMEYLITYSWAIIIIGITLGALYALGVFTPSNIINTECIFPADFGCLTSILYQNGTLVINMQQTTTSSINVTAVGCNAAGVTTNMTQYSTSNQIYLNIGGNASFSTQCYANGTVYTSFPNTVYKGYVLMNYTNLQTGFRHVVIGKLIAKST